jgi:hypothetical protein
MIVSEATKSSQQVASQPIPHHEQPLERKLPITIIHPSIHMHAHEKSAPSHSFLEN